MRVPARPQPRPEAAGRTATPASARAPKADPFRRGPARLPEEKQRPCRGEVASAAVAGSAKSRAVLDTAVRANGTADNSVSAAVKSTAASRNTTTPAAQAGLLDRNLCLRVLVNNAAHMDSWDFFQLLSSLWKTRENRNMILECVSENSTEVPRLVFDQLACLRNAVR